MAWGQQADKPVAAYIDSRSPEAAASQVAAFRNGLGEIGYVEGRNVTIEYRWGNNERRAPEFWVELLRRQVNA